MADDTAQAELMRDLVEYLRQMPAFKRLRKHLLILYAYGDTNIISDAMSRGYSAVASAFAQQLNITLLATNIPPTVGEFMTWLRAQHRRLTLLATSRRRRPLDRS